MWTKEAPKEPGYYWFRYPQMIPINRDDNPTIVRVMKSRWDERLTCAFPGNDDCPTPMQIAGIGDAEWWTDPICLPGGEILPKFELRSDDSSAFPYIGIEWNNGVQSFFCSVCGRSQEACKRNNSGVDLKSNPAKVLPDLPGKQELEGQGFPEGTLDKSNPQSNRSSAETAHLRERAEHD